VTIWQVTYARWIVNSRSICRFESIDIFVGQTRNGAFPHDGYRAAHNAPREIAFRPPNDLYPDESHRSAVAAFRHRDHRVTLILRNFSVDQVTTHYDSTAAWTTPVSASRVRISHLSGRDDYLSIGASYGSTPIIANAWFICERRPQDCGMVSGNIYGATCHRERNKFRLDRGSELIYQLNPYRAELCTK